MTYSIAHNIKVIGQVAEKLNVDHIPKTLLCNVHPLMMDIHNSLGNKKKIVESFLVDVDFKNESFVIKSINFLSNFINQDYPAKPWKRSNHFASFIVPKKINHYLLKTIDSTDFVNVH